MAHHCPAAGVLDRRNSRPDLHSRQRLAGRVGIEALEVSRPQVAARRRTRLPPQARQPGARGQLTLARRLKVSIMPPLWSPSKAPAQGSDQARQRRPCARFERPVPYGQPSAAHMPKPDSSCAFIVGCARARAPCYPDGSIPRRRLPTWLVALALQRAAVHIREDLHAERAHLLDGALDLPQRSFWVIHWQRSSEAHEPIRIAVDEVGHGIIGDARQIDGHVPEAPVRSAASTG